MLISSQTLNPFQLNLEKTFELPDAKVEIVLWLGEILSFVTLQNTPAATRSFIAFPPDKIMVSFPTDECCVKTFDY